MSHRQNKVGTRLLFVSESEFSAARYGGIPTTMKAQFQHNAAILTMCRGGRGLGGQRESFSGHFLSLGNRVRAAGWGKKESNELCSTVRGQSRRNGEVSEHHYVLFLHEHSYNPLTGKKGGAG